MQDKPTATEIETPSSPPAGHERTIEAAVADAQFVQENGPERVDLKRDLFRRLDAAAPDAVRIVELDTCAGDVFEAAGTSRAAAL